MVELRIVNVGYQVLFSKISPAFRSAGILSLKVNSVYFSLRTRTFLTMPVSWRAGLGCLINHTASFLAANS